VATLRIVTDYNAVDKRAEDFKRAMHNIRVVKDVEMSSIAARWSAG